MLCMSGGSGSFRKLAEAESEGEGAQVGEEAGGQPEASGFTLCGRWRSDDTYLVLCPRPSPCSRVKPTGALHHLLWPGEGEGWILDAF